MILDLSEFTTQGRFRPPCFTNSALFLPSVVGVHGIHGKSRETWSAAPATPANKTWLANAFKRATDSEGRVILYGYESNAYTGRCHTLRGVYQEAQALLDKLVELRTPDAVVCLTPQLG